MEDPSQHARSARGDRLGGPKGSASATVVTGGGAPCLGANHTWATQSISIMAPGATSALTITVDRAGGPEGKYET